MDNKRVCSVLVSMNYSNAYWTLKLCCLNLFIEIKKERQKTLLKFNAISWRRRHQQPRKQLTQFDTVDPDSESVVSFTFKMSSIDDNRLNSDIGIISMWTGQKLLLFCTLYTTHYAHRHTRTLWREFKYPSGSNLTEWNRTYKYHWLELMSSLFWQRRNCNFSHLICHF